MSSTGDGIWFELRPNGHPSLAVWNPKRYGSREDAEQAAGEMRERSPDFRFVEIISYEVRGGKLSGPTWVARV